MYRPSARLRSPTASRPPFAVANEGAVHQLTKRTALTFVFDEDGLGAGEHAYADGPTTLEDFVEVARNEVPAAFWERSPNPAGAG